MRVMVIVWPMLRASATSKDVPNVETHLGLI